MDGRWPSCIDRLHCRTDWLESFMGETGNLCHHGLYKGSGWYPKLVLLKSRPNDVNGHGQFRSTGFNGSSLSRPYSIQQLSVAWVMHNGKQELINYGLLGINRCASACCSKCTCPTSSLLQSQKKTNTSLVLHAHQRLWLVSFQTTKNEEYLLWLILVTCLERNQSRALGAHRT